MSAIINIYQVVYSGRPLYHTASCHALSLCRASSVGDVARRAFMLCSHTSEQAEKSGAGEYIDPDVSVLFGT